MTIVLSPEMSQLVEEKLKAGEYDSAEAVVFAGLRALDRIEDDFAPGELDQLLAEAEESIEKDGTLDGEEAFAARRQRRAQLRGRAS
ncbi:MAG TPA: type II toxin-antitoxin system ParD family antitoxin [Tepidisphaeraceae bacterium]|jgi:putative addiction module CopG family antidote|nr:type II toxin-antitoxin system ParD family antitoxin [Tepidisphaeraceae bacterium]